MSLKLQSRFPGGNGQLVQLDATGEIPELRFAAEAHGGAAALWFCFRLVESDASASHPAKLKLTLLYADTLNLGGSGAHLHPVYQPEEQGFYRTAAGIESHTADGRLSVSWQIPYPTGTTLWALCYPYGRRDLDTLVSKSRGFWHSDPIGLSRGGRPIRRLSNHVDSASPRPGIYLVARQHPGETPGSWVLDGLLQRLSRSKRCPVDVWAIPFADPDGLDYGDYGKGDPIQDLDAAWGASPRRHEARVIQQDLQRWQSRTRPLLVLDLQSPPGASVAGITHRLPRADCERAVASEAQAWANTFLDALREWTAPAQPAEEEPSVETLSAGAGSLVEFVAGTLGLPALALEVPYATCGGSVMSQKLYREVGSKLADALIRRVLDLDRH